MNILIENKHFIIEQYTSQQYKSDSHALIYSLKYIYDNYINELSKIIINCKYSNVIKNISFYNKHYYNFYKTFSENNVDIILYDISTDKYFDYVEQISGKKARTYQKLVNNAISFELLTANKCLVKMFCGTGKSFVMTHIKYIQIMKPKLIVYVFPSLALISQFFNDYIKDIYESNNVLNVSSEYREDIISTTNMKDIENFMDNNDEKIILVTYDSYDLLLNSLKQNIDICIYDEAHHCTANSINKQIFNRTKCNKQIFFTATPKNTNDIYMYNDKISDCGRLVYNYTYMQGVNDGYLAEFEIRCNLYCDGEYQNINNKVTIYEYICRAIIETGNTRILTFHSDVNTNRNYAVNNFVNEQEFINTFNRILQEYPTCTKYHTSNIQMFSLQSAISSKDRIHILNKLDTTSDDDIIIISSCKTIGEGVDTKNANMCVFVDPKKSYVDIIQNIGRILRPNKNKKSTILIPCHINKKNYIDCNGDGDKIDKEIKKQMKTDNGDFQPMMNIFSALKQEDNELYEQCLYYSEILSKYDHEINLHKQGYKIVEDTPLTISEIEKQSENICVEIYNESLENPIIKINDCINDTIRFYKENDEEYYSIIKCDTNETITTDKIQQPIKKLTFNVYLNNELKILWNIDESSIKNITQKISTCIINCKLIDSQNENWYRIFELLKKFMDKYNKRPASYSKNIEEKQLGNWLSNQLNNYKNKIKTMRNVNIRITFENFLDVYKKYFIISDEQWYKNFKSLNNFMDKYNKRPILHSKNADEKKLAQWLGYQLKTYKNNTQNINIKKDFEEFINKYKQYFISNDEQWYENFKLVKEFVNTYNRLPSTHIYKEKQLAQWFQRQITICKNNTQIMKNDNIRTLFIEFLKEHNIDCLKSNELNLTTFQKNTFQKKYDEYLTYLKKK